MLYTCESKLPSFFFHHMIVCWNTSCWPSVSLFDPKTLAQTGRIDTSDDIECASLSPDGRFLAAGSKIKAKEFTVDGTELEQHRGHHGPIFHVRYSPDGANIATGAEDGMVRVWPSHQVIQRFETA